MSMKDGIPEKTENGAGCALDRQNERGMGRNKKNCKRLTGLQLSQCNVYNLINAVGRGKSFTCRNFCAEKGLEKAVLTPKSVT